MSAKAPLVGITAPTPAAVERRSSSRRFSAAPFERDDLGIGRHILHACVRVCRPSGGARIRALHAATQQSLGYNWMLVSAPISTCSERSPVSGGLFVFLESATSLTRTGANQRMTGTIKTLRA